MNPPNTVFMSCNSSFNNYGPGQQADSGDGAKVGNKIQHRHEDSPDGGVGNAQPVETRTHDHAQANMNQRNGEQVIGNVLLNLVADCDRALFVAHRGHHADQFLQKQVTRGEQ